MTISLSEQLESDIKAYLHKTFGTYFSSLDERFAADIKEDVINASDFHHGYYNDDDISIAFQRVTLGRMGHPDWQIYHSCTDIRNCGLLSIAQRIMALPHSTATGRFHSGAPPCAGTGRPPPSAPAGSLAAPLFRPSAPRYDPPRPRCASDGR